MSLGECFPHAASYKRATKKIWHISRNVPICSLGTLTRKLAQLNIPDLTPEEREHITKGGRVFIVEEIEGPLWRVLMVKGNTCKVLLKPQDMEGYSDREDAYLNARGIANLAEDSPLVRALS